MSKPLVVQVLKDGPLKLSAERIRLTYAGEPISIDPGKNVFVCRCGESKNAPFCDGSHGRTGFDGTCGLQRDAKAIRTWEGRTIKTHFNPNTCMHVFYCKPLQELRERELAGDDSAAEEIIAVVRSCPSGALSYESTVDVPVETGDEVDVAIMEGGEVRIQCAFEINEPLNERQTADKATLCRCGRSKNKPWCDGRHKGRKDFR